MAYKFAYVIFFEFVYFEGTDTASRNLFYVLYKSFEWVLFGYNTRSAIRSTPSPRKYSRTFVLIYKSFVIKIQINSIFTPKSLRMSNFCCTFAPDFKIS